MGAKEGRRKEGRRKEAKNERGEGWEETREGR